MPDPLIKAARLLSAGYGYTPTQKKKIIFNMSPDDRVMSFRATTWGTVILCSGIYLYREPRNAPGEVMTLNELASGPNPEIFQLLFGEDLHPHVAGELETFFFNFWDPEKPGTITGLSIMSALIRANQQFNEHKHLLSTS